jgi:hypothetical protein
MKKLLLLVLLSIVSLTVYAAPTPPQADNKPEQVNVTEQLKTAEAKWQQNQPTHYSYNLQRSCFCTQEYNKPIEIEVLNGTVQQAILLPENTPLPTERKDEALTVNDLFNLIHKAIDKKAASIEVKYDTQYGFPTTISIDWEKMMADEETYYTASDLKPK